MLGNSHISSYKKACKRQEYREILATGIPSRTSTTLQGTKDKAPGLRRKIKKKILRRKIRTKKEEEISRRKKQSFSNFSTDSAALENKPYLPIHRRGISPIALRGYEGYQSCIQRIGIFGQRQDLQHLDKILGSVFFLTPPRLARPPQRREVWTMPRIVRQDCNMCNHCFCLFFRALTESILLIILHGSILIFVDSFLRFLHCSSTQAKYILLTSLFHRPVHSHLS